MSNTAVTKRDQQPARGGAVVAFKEPRLPYHPAIGERFGIDKSGWRALVDAIFPLATSADSIVLALSYCKARSLDPFKRAVHIVPVWSRDQGRMVDTVWPGIGELRTTAFRTGLYAGRDDAEFGPDITKNLGGLEVTFPEWCRVTVYRMCGGDRRVFAGPKVYWTETYATEKRDSMKPNSMWAKRPRGQIEKCAEAAALRAAFPEEIGDTYAAEEMEGKTLESVGGSSTPGATGKAPGTAAAQLQAFAATPAEPEPEDYAEPEVKHTLLSPDGEVLLETTSSTQWLEHFEHHLKKSPEPAKLWEVNADTAEWAADNTERGDEFLFRLRDTYLPKESDQQQPAAATQDQGAERQAAPADEWEDVLADLIARGKATTTVTAFTNYKADEAQQIRELPPTVRTRWEQFAVAHMAALKGGKA